MNIRKYGKSPYELAVVHGGPGGAGEVEPVARFLSRFFGVLEPIQNARSVKGQVDELYESTRPLVDKPVVLAGHSWGAWLSLLCAAKYPELVKKLILISSGPFEDRYAEGINRQRISRLSVNERKEYFDILNRLGNNNPPSRNDDFLRLGDLCKKADIVEPVDDAPAFTPAVELTDDPEKIHMSIWPEAARLRTSGGLLSSAACIKCPVIVIHGDNDSHPFQGVKEPLSRHFKNMQCYVLDKCGHYPWLEKHASVKFYEIMRYETLK